MPTCEIITIGSELLDGSVLNTNAQFLARHISKLNISVVRQLSCRDREEEILAALAAAFKHADLIIVTGGLGPTPDDITREAIAKFFGCNLKFDKAQYRNIVRYFQKTKRVAPFITRREAFLPKIAKPLLNQFGIALGFYIWQNGSLLIALPGVPQELIGMYQSTVQKLIQKKLGGQEKIYTFEARIAGLYETHIMRKLGKQFFKNRKFDFGIYPEIGEVTVRIKTPSKLLSALLKKELMKKLSGFIFSFEGESLASVIGRLLLRRKNTVAIAESCTGGLLAKEMTDCGGASRYFRGGVVAYSNEVKVAELGVAPELIRTGDAVSKEVASALAKGVRLKYKSNIGVGITGIAGPGGGSFSKPVGLVYCSISSPEKRSVYEFHFSGDRQKIRMQATRKALFYLWQWLKTP